MAETDPHPADTLPDNDRYGQAARPAHHGLPLPRDTTPTWEVELLISGVAVFAMLQLPGWIEDRYFEILPRLDESWRELLNLAHIYRQSATLLLAVTFVLHLLLRAHWIAVVGMSSVASGGVDWSRMRMGPIQLAHEQSRFPGVPAIIERADNRASQVFAVGVMLTTMMISISVIALAVALSATIVTKLGLPLSAGWVITFIMFGALFPFMIAVFIDRTKGTQLQPGSRVHRILSRAFPVFSRLGFSRTSNPISTLLSSHNGDRHTAVVITCLIMLSMFSVFASIALQRIDYGVGSYGWLPPIRRDAGEQINRAHYDSLRDIHRGAILPFIPEEIVTADFLKLQIPFVPRSHNPALDRQCPDVRLIRSDRDRQVAVLNCLSAMHMVTIDGQPLAVNLFFASDPRLDTPTLQAMIDVRDLSAGQHQLTVTMPPVDSDAEDASDDTNDADAEPKPTFDRIPFWR